MSKLLSLDAALRELNDAAWGAVRAARRAGDTQGAEELARIASRIDNMVDALPARVAQ